MQPKCLGVKNEAIRHNIKQKNQPPITSIDVPLFCDTVNLDLPPTDALRRH
jgi:hypothetical protein